MRRLRISLFIAVAAILLSACRVETTAKVDVRANGSGTVAVEVVLDKAATAQVPDLEEKLQTGDLTKAGWHVDVDMAGDKSDDVTTVKAAHSFDTPTQGEALLTQLTGQDGVFREVHLTQNRSFSKVQTSFAGTVDLTKGMDGFGDAGLLQRTGYAFGFDTQETADALDFDWAQDFPLTLEVHLPGKTSSVSPTQNADGSWALPYGETTLVATSSSGPNMIPIIFATIGALCLVAVVGVLLLWPSGKYRGRHRKSVRSGGGTRARDLLKADQRKESRR